MKTHDPELLDQVLDAWKAIQISPIDPLALLHWPTDELTPEELILHLRVEVGRKGVIVPLVVLLLTSLPVLLGVFLGIVHLGMIFQVDWTDPFLLILIIIVIHSNSLNGESSLSDLFAGPLPCLRDCSSSSHSSMAHSLSLMMLGKVALLDLLVCGVFLFLGRTTRS